MVEPIRCEYIWSQARTMEIESSIVSHEYVAEAAVVSFKHEIKGG